MQNLKLYDRNSIFDFGKHYGETLKEVSEKSKDYIAWCFQKIDWFCITDDVFDKLPIAIFLRKENDLKNLKILTDIQIQKKERLERYLSSYETDIQVNHTENCDEDNEPYMLGDPRYDRDENPWIDVFGEGDEAETAYWNTD